MATARQPGAPRWRSYTEAERAQAVGLALTVGDKRAAAQLGIPRRTISSWRRTPTPAVQAAISRSPQDVAARLWEAVTVGTDAVLTGLRDPRARLGDKANTLRIVVEAHALLTGGATARTEATISTQPAMTWQQQADLRDWIDRMLELDDDAARAWLASGGLEAIRTGELSALGDDKDRTDA